MNLGPFDQRVKAFAHRGHLLKLAAGELPPPVSVKIELTNVCNHDCHFCAYRRIVQEPRIKDRLEEGRVLELVDELAAGGVQGLMFTGGGEPLVHPGCETIFERCRARGLEHALITNGTRLGRISDEALGGMRWIRFSINAGSPEAYERVHGAPRSDWDRAWEGVRRSANKTAHPQLTVGVSFVVTSWNQDGVSEAASRARDAGADYIHVRPAFEGPHSQIDRQLTPSESDARIQELEALAALETASFRVHGVRRRFEELERVDRTAIHCRTTPLVSYVLPTGEVSLCTLVRDASFNSAVPDPFLGNVYKARFFELWGNARHRALITSLSSSGCNRCHFAEYNRVLAEVENDVHHASFL